MKIVGVAASQEPVVSILDQFWIGDGSVLSQFWIGSVGLTAAVTSDGLSV